MGTLFGISLFSAVAALTIDKAYEAVVHTTSTAASVGRYTVFTGTWTAISAFFGFRKMKQSSKRVKERASLTRRLIGRSKGKVDGDSI